MPGGARSGNLDFAALGSAMTENTDAQAALNASLVSDTAKQVIETARRHNALGWKVNGAGGEGGSVTILSGSSPSVKRGMIAEIEGIDDKITHIPIYLSRHGLRVWETT